MTTPACQIGPLGLIRMFWNFLSNPYDNVLTGTGTGTGPYTTVTPLTKDDVNFTLGDVVPLALGNTNESYLFHLLHYKKNMTEAILALKHRQNCIYSGPQNSKGGFQTSDKCDYDMWGYVFERKNPRDNKWVSTPFYCSITGMIGMYFGNLECNFGVPVELTLPAKLNALPKSVAEVKKELDSIANTSNLILSRPGFGNIMALLIRNYHLPVMPGNFSTTLLP